MKAFLEQVADHLASSFGDDISGVCIVLPNLRAGLFLRKFLAARLNKTIWSPRICSSEEFLTSVAGLRHADQLQLLFKLYEIHKDIEQEKAQPFGDFIRWAPQLLNDFDEADRYLADTRKLFSALTDVRAISVWNPGNRELTEFEKQYLKFYASLYLYYSRLVDELLEHKQAYPGLIFRMASLGIEKFSKKLPWKKVVFTGFNSVTAAEEHVMDVLQQQGKAEFLWDADEYYLNDNTQEAGEFLRNNREKWGGKEFKWVSSDIKTQPKTIRITGVPNNNAQAGFAGELLKEIRSPDEKTAVVLQDENLLFPLLYSLPAGIGEMNITMGLPLLQTPFSDLLALVFRMQINREKFTAGGRKGELFYFRDVLALLRHSCIPGLAAGLMQGNQFVLDKMIESISFGNKVFIRPDEILNPGTGLFSANAYFLEPLFTIWKTPEDAIHACKEILGSFRDHLINKKETLDLEYLFAFSKIIQQIDRLIRDNQGIIKTIQALSDLFSLMVQTVTLPFFGEPLNGMQIMGMHETRGLDFTNLIMLSCNENLLPRGRSGSSFIPPDLKLEFGLPTYRQKDAVYAYHFYRLLQRASDIHLLYNSEPGKLGGGEMSRFLQQIISELKRVNPSVTLITEILVMESSASSASAGISIKKDETVKEMLWKKAETGLSPTSLNNFRSCALKFFLSDLAGLQQPDEMEEEIDNRILGNIVHEALHRLYRGVMGKDLVPADIAGMKTRVGQTIDEACSKVFSGRDVNYGRNLLLVRVAKIILMRFIETEILFLNDLKQKGETLGIVALEQRLERRLIIKTGNRDLVVKVKGFADRIDQAGKNLRIIDYKSGATDSRRTKVGNWEEFASDPGKDHAFQLLAYNWLYYPRRAGDFPLQAGILSLRKLKEGLIAVTVPSSEEKKGNDNLTVEDLNLFETSLKQVLNAIFDTTAGFTQTSDQKMCAKCQFINICGR